MVFLGGLSTTSFAKAKATGTTPESVANAAEQAKPSKFSTDWIETKLAKLQRKLHITPAQQAAWDAYAKEMRESAKAMEPLYTRYYTQQATMTAVENMRLFMEMSEARAKTLGQLIPLFEKLYTMMSDQQKQVADELFSDQVAPRQRKK